MPERELTSRAIIEHGLSSRESIHFQVLRVLKANPHCSQRELAEQLGVSLGRAHYCLSALIDKGWMKVDNFNASGNKWGYAYVLTPLGIAQKAALTGRFLQRKLAEFEDIKAEIEGLAREYPEEAASLGIPLENGKAGPSEMAESGLTDAC